MSIPTTAQPDSPRAHHGAIRRTTTRRRAIALFAVIAATAATSIDTGAQAATVAEIFGKPAQGSSKVVDHAAWTTLLQAYVKPGADGVNRVDYAKWKSESHAALKAYVRALQDVDPTTLDRSEQFAFWANLYNAKTIDVVLDAYPVKSIKDINLGGSLLTIVTGGPWKAKVAQVKGQSLSLDDIEHNILRPVMKDPRVHYSVNCASIGCPNLMTEAFTGAKLEAQLDAGAKAYVNHPRGITVGNGKITASSIYSWFQADFGGTAAGVLEHVRKYADPDLTAKLKGAASISDYGYDWRLNEVTK